MLERKSEEVRAEGYRQEDRDLEDLEEDAYLESMS